MSMRVKHDGTIYIVGGGPSLCGVDLASVLEGLPTIAINRAYQDVPDADVVYWSDWRFWRYYGGDVAHDGSPGVMAHPALYKVTGNERFAGVLGVTVLPFTGRPGLESGPGHLRHGQNAGHAAINLAVHLGAKSLILLGYDFYHEGDRTHYHDGYPVTAPEGKLPRFVANLETLVEPLARLGVSVINASPRSALTCWPRVPLSEALPAGRIAA